MEWEIVFDLVEHRSSHWGMVLSGVPPLLAGLVFLAFCNRLAEFSQVVTKLMGKRSAVANRVLLPVRFLLTERFFFYFGWFVFLLGVLWIVSVKTVISRDFEGLEAAYLNGEFQVQEGRVDSFKPASYCPGERSVGWGNGPGVREPDSAESFFIDKLKFTYADSVITGGFNHTKPCGGPLREGQIVKVSHVDGVILRLEILQTPKNS